MLKNEDKSTKQEMNNGIAAMFCENMPMKGFFTELYML